MCWVDSDAEEDDGDAVQALHLHSASCASSYCDYSAMLLKVFTMDAELLRPELWKWLQTKKSKCAIMQTHSSFILSW